MTPAHRLASEGQEQFLFQLWRKALDYLEGSRDRRRAHLQRHFSVGSQRHREQSLLAPEHRDAQIDAIDRVLDMVEVMDRLHAPPGRQDNRRAILWQRQSDRIIDAEGSLG